MDSWYQMYAQMFRSTVVASFWLLSPLLFPQIAPFLLTPHFGQQEEDSNYFEEDTNVSPEDFFVTTAPAERRKRYVSCFGPVCDQLVLYCV